MFNKEFFSKIKSNISIKTKLILVIIILFIYSILIMGFIGYKSYAKIFEDKFISYSSENTADITRQLNQSVDSLNFFSLQVLYNDFIYESYLQLTQNDENDTILERNLKVYFEYYLKSILLSRNDCDAIIFRFSDGGRSYTVSKDSTYTFPPPLIDGIYQKVRNNNRQPYWYIDRHGNNNPGIYLSRMVYDRNSRNEIGMFVYKINSTRLFEMFKDYALNKSQNISIYDKNNLELFTYNTFDVNYGEALATLLKPSFEQGVYVSKLKSDRIYFIYNAVPASDWRIITAVSSNILLKDVRKVLNTVIFLCLITLPIWIVLINFLYIDIIKPLDILVGNMRKIEKGAVGIKVETRRRDEIGFVFKTFNRMSEEINNLINRVYKGQLAMKDAEIKALQAQINPHFLYNTLETINWKARIHGVEEISEMVSAFSSIIEANLNRGNGNFIPLHSEIEYINNYYLLIKKRFGKRINFTMDVQKDILECKIPKLLIQPLIENAIYHGIEIKKGGGTISLSINREDDLLLVKVSDDGVGIGDEKLEKLREKLMESVDESHAEDKGAADGQKEKNRTSIGIINVHKRVRLLYGDDYGLEIDSISGNGTTITVKLPFETDKGDELHVQSPDNR